jgi:hypothetical protein
MLEGDKCLSSRENNSTSQAHSVTMLTELCMYQDSPQNVIPQSSLKMVPQIVKYFACPLIIGVFERTHHWILF